MKYAKVADLMAQLYHAELNARTTLAKIDFPMHLMPAFTTPQAFWVEVVQLIEAGVGPSIADLLSEAARTFPGNTDVKVLYAEYGQATTPSMRITQEGPCPALTLMGVDLPEQFLAAVREKLGVDAAQLLYVTNQQCAVSIPDPGDDGARLQQQVQELIQSYVPAGERFQVAYERFPFRPYLISELTVFGPDTTPYRLQSVPATMLPRDIAAAVLAQNSAMTDRSGGTVNAVVDAETDTGSHRLDMNLTLHENKVRDKGKLRVGARAMAGNINPELRMEAQLRMRAQIRRFAYGHLDFEIVDYDNEDLPNRLTFTLAGPGLKPPPELDDFLAGTEPLSNEDYRTLSWEQLRPVPIDSHRFTVHLPAMFPVVAPFAVWETPVFHPNIWRRPAVGARPGMVCLGPLMDGYRPDLDFGYLCQLLIDIGTYQNYDVVEADTYPDPEAALWARTEAGQEIITALGGKPMRPRTERADEKRPAGGFFLGAFGDQPDEAGA